jgi:LysR family hca operon transcriptional activator
MVTEMELRHLRYFVAVAEAGGLTGAAQRQLHTSQPSLSRQIRDLEEEVGAQLLTRRARGIELTPAGRTFLDHARLVLSQVAAAVEAARRVAHPSKPFFTMGFLTGHELKWMPEALRILRDELPNIDVLVSSRYSPLLVERLSKGKIDAAFLRMDSGLPELAYRVLVKEPLMVILPGDHRLAALKAISPTDLDGETFVAVAKTAPVLRALVDKYLKRSGVNITPKHEADHLAMGMSLIASTRGVGLLPGYAQNFSAVIVNQSSSERRCTNCRSCPRLQKVEPVSHPQALAFESGRAGCACVKYERINRKSTSPTRRKNMRPFINRPRIRRKHRSWFWKVLFRDAT